jgi:3-deoxy-7-phosphoheptulonate synthase
MGGSPELTTERSEHMLKGINSTDDVRIRKLRPLLSPAILHEQVPLLGEAEKFVETSRAEVSAVVSGEDTRLLVVVGPCSIHDVDAAREYAGRLAALTPELADALLIVMRVYFEKPRTTVGWKGLINDPFRDGSFRINEGVVLARRLLVDLADMGVRAGCEFLDTISPQFIADTVSWGAIGARTTESQIHRELASGLSMQVGFKNGTDGSVSIAIDAITAASHPHCFLSVTKEGIAAIVETEGNPDGHIILRGASSGPNFSTADVGAMLQQLKKAGLRERVMVDCSHGNSGKIAARQLDVVEELSARLAAGEQGILGVMLESHLMAGKQGTKPGAELIYGQSITDECIGWADTEQALLRLAEAVRAR